LQGFDSARRLQKHGAGKKEYTAYVNELGDVLIDFDKASFSYAYPYTTKHLTVLERGMSRDGRELVEIHARLTELVRQRKAKTFELAMEENDFGVLVLNKAERGALHDKVVAYITPCGDLRWYVLPGYTPALAAIKIRQRANIMANKYETWLDKLNDDEQRELDELHLEDETVWRDKAWCYKVDLLCRCLDMDRSRLFSLYRGFQRWAKKHSWTPFPIQEHRAQIRAFLGNGANKSRDTLELFCSQEQAARVCNDLDCAWCPINITYMTLKNVEGEN